MVILSHQGFAMQNTLPAMFDSGAATHVGRVRTRNEDRYLVRPEVGIWAVADGMGGHQAGDLASETVIAALQSIDGPTSAAELLSSLEDRVAHANSDLRAISRARGGAVLGTTLAVLLVADSYYACVWSGDSRIYIIRAGEIAQLSRDHTEVQELIASGVISQQEAKSWPGAHVVTRAIGVYDDSELEIVSGPLEAGDSFIICTDGLTHHVTDGEIRDCVRANVSQQACDSLVTLALERGGNDNITIVVARYQAALGPSPTLEGKLADPT
jgi:serine/threonine protein phosphatase PrpC